MPKIPLLAPTVARVHEAKKLSEVCPDAHGAKEVEEDHGAVSGVIPGQAAGGSCAARA